LPSTGVKRSKKTKRIDAFVTVVTQLTIMTHTVIVMFWPVRGLASRQAAWCHRGRARRGGRRPSERLAAFQEAAPVLEGGQGGQGGQRTGDTYDRYDTYDTYVAAYYLREGAGRCGDDAGTICSRMVM
jgi:hypothetical protein